VLKRLSTLADHWVGRGGRAENWRREAEEKSQTRDVVAVAFLLLQGVGGASLRDMFGSSSCQTLQVARKGPALNSKWLTAEGVAVMFPLGDLEGSIEQRRVCPSALTGPDQLAVRVGFCSVRVDDENATTWGTVSEGHSFFEIEMSMRANVWPDRRGLERLGWSIRIYQMEGWFCGTLSAIHTRSSRRQGGCTNGDQGRFAAFTGLIGLRGPVWAAWAACRVF
jgi:hypothetical protein